ncbi:hypothetical protein ACFWZ2_28720 [Streptomyces sp. NPDC059002]|uniref:hypothetical protein n=1 Tax=Streptomyces sp. NPDC059002 TaxID=3346690 RepID=UPI0036C0C649
MPPELVELRLVTQHFLSYNAPRTGHADPAHYHLSCRVDGAPVTGELDTEDLFSQLGGRFERLGGREGQLLTASSAVQVLAALAAHSDVLVHAPAPGGLPGGYPVRLRGGARVDLGPRLTLGEAVRINEECQRADGIESIAADGTVTFTGPEMAVMKRLLGYECRTMPLADTAHRAEELGRKYRQLTES